jgi:hypothetical protein
MGLVLTACGLLPPPDWVTNRQPLPSCGEEVVEQGGPFDVAARECLLQAQTEGREAELISTQRSVEGDPIITYMRVHENGTIEIFVDSRQDRFQIGRLGTSTLRQPRAGCPGERAA